MGRDSTKDGIEYLLDLHLQKIGYDNGYWVTMRVFRIEPDTGRPHGLQYALTLHDHNDDRVLGFDNSHAISVGSGPAKRSRRPKQWDHIDRRDQKSVPYRFVSPYQLVEDFFKAVDEILNESQEGML